MIVKLLILGVSGLKLIVKVNDGVQIELGNWDLLRPLNQAYHLTSFILIALIPIQMAINFISIVGGVPHCLFAFLRDFVLTLLIDLLGPLHVSVGHKSAVRTRLRLWPLPREIVPVPVAERFLLGGSSEPAACGEQKR